MGTAGKKKPVCVLSHDECCSVSVTTGGIHTRGVGTSGRATGPHRAGAIGTGFIEEKWYQGGGSNPQNPKGHRMLSPVLPESQIENPPGRLAATRDR